jgi:hypothetical protein
MVNIVSENELEKLWGDGVVRVFISHIADHKVFATGLKASLERYGIASFVAHEDIEPMKEWELEIERALFSMDILVALLTEGFSESKWTDQEVGVAVGREVPIVPVRLGRDPYGFMARYQAVPGSQSPIPIADAVFSYIFSNENLRTSVVDAYITALANSGSFDRSNSLAKYLPQIQQLSPEQEERLVRVFNSNGQVRGAFDIHDEIAEHLKRMTGRDYKIDYTELRLSESHNDLPF